MEQAIKLALDGGWEPFGPLFHKNLDEEQWGVPELIASFYHQPTFLLYPLFWQALGKSCGWERNFALSSYGASGTEPEIIGKRMDTKTFDYVFDGDNKEDFSINRLISEWQYRALRFYEINLTEGMDKAVEYLTTLLNESK